MMDSKNSNFGKLKIGEVFEYHGQTYQKESEDSALMLQWVTGEEVSEEMVMHRFFAEIVVQIVDPDEDV